MPEFQLNPSVWAGIETEWLPAHVPTKAGLRTAEKLLVALRQIGCIPHWAIKGYWPTVIFGFENFPVEFQCFDDCFEIDVFKPLCNVKWGRDFYEYKEADSSNITKAMTLISSLIVKNS